MNARRRPGAAYPLGAVMLIAAFLVTALAARPGGPMPRAAQGVDRPRVHQHPGAIMDRAVTAYSKVRTLRARFEQTLTNRLTGSITTAHGEFQQSRPALIAVRFSDPAGDRIVADGHLVWIYLPSTTPGQVIKMPATAAGGVAVDLTARFLDAPRARYTLADAGTATVSGRPAHAVGLTPKTDQPFVKATVWVDDADATVRQFEVTDGSGLTRRVRLTSLAINGPVDRTAFAFTPPPGVKVVDQSVLAGVPQRVQ